LVWELLRVLLLLCMLIHTQWPLIHPLPLAVTINITTPTP